jgi:hypothetical protein
MKDLVIMAIIEILDKKEISKYNTITLLKEEIHLPKEINFFEITYLYYTLICNDYEIIDMKKNVITVLVNKKK